MNKQRKVVITITYNEMGIIIDTKAEEITQPNLQSTCNQLATDTISRQAAIDLAEDLRDCISVDGYWAWIERLKKLPYAEDRPTGKWQRVRKGRFMEGEPDIYACDKCGGKTWYKSKFCSDCGARMSESEERQEE